MLLLSARLIFRRLFPCALVLLAGVAQSAGPASAATRHPLVTASEALYQRKLIRSCDEVRRLALVSPELTEDDRIRFHFLAAVRAIDDGDRSSARAALARALRIDRSVAVPPFASSPPLLKLLEEVRPNATQLVPAVEQETPLPTDVDPASLRGPAPRVLLTAVETLYVKLQIEGAGVVLELAGSSKPLTPADHAQIALWRGVLKMEWADEAGARAAFREALEADRNVRLPRSVQGKTSQVFEQEKQARSASAGPIIQHQEQQVTVNTTVMPKITVLPAPPDRSVLDIVFAEGPQRPGLYVAGAGLALIGGGALAGSIALTAYRDQQVASTNGDWDAYVRSRDTGKMAATVADGLYGAGALAVGAGVVFIFLRSPPGIAIGANGGPGHSFVVVGGSF